MSSTWTDSRLEGRLERLNRSRDQGMVAPIGIITVLLAAFLTVVATHF